MLSKCTLIIMIMMISTVKYCFFKNDCIGSQFIKFVYNYKISSPFSQQLCGLYYTGRLTYLRQYCSLLLSHILLTYYDDNDLKNVYNKSVIQTHGTHTLPHFFLLSTIILLKSDF